jgi:hypothetical protein
MCSSGIRLGACDCLRWKHEACIPEQNNKSEIIAAKLSEERKEIEEMKKK